MELVKQIDELLGELEDANENADMANSIFALRQIRERVVEYEEAFSFLFIRLNWGTSDAASHAYQRAIARLVSGLTWQQALDFEED